MPVVNIKIIEGRTVDQKRTMVQAVTKAIASSLEIPESAVWISIDEMKADNFSQGGELRCDKQNK